MSTRHAIRSVQQVVRGMVLPPGYNQEALHQLADYTDQLEAQVRAVASVCQSTDGEYLDGEVEIPVGEVLRMLVETGARLDSLRIEP